jgi:HEPN domain-containing protein
MFDVLESEAPELEEATGVEYDERVGGVLTQEPSDGTATVAFQVQATNPNSAYADALDAYEQLRRRAGLAVVPPLSGTITQLRGPATTGAGPPGASHPPPAVTAEPLPHERLLEKAHLLAGRDEHDYATVAAQTACELAVARGIRRLVADQAPHLQASIEKLIGRRYSLSQKAVSDLWDQLARDDIRSADFWHGYTEHLVRRNAIAHEGASVTSDDADSSIETAEHFCEHVTTRTP